MWVCDSHRCRETNINEPSEGRFTIEVDGYGDSIGGEFSCVYCGEFGYDCGDCDSDYWCSEHRTVSRGEQQVYPFSNDLVWINKNKEPQHVIN